MSPFGSRVKKLRACVVRTLIKHLLLCFTMATSGASVTQGNQDVSGLVFEHGPESSFVMTVEKIKLRPCFWSRF